MGSQLVTASLVPSIWLLTPPITSPALSALGNDATVPPRLFPGAFAGAGRHDGDSQGPTPSARSTCTTQVDDDMDTYNRIVDRNRHAGSSNRIVTLDPFCS